MHCRLARLLLAAAVALLISPPAAGATVYVYWGNQGSDSIGRADVDGASNIPGFIPGTGRVRAIATDKSHIYWAGTDDSFTVGIVGRASIDGTSPDSGFITPATYADGVAVDGSHVYWSNTGLHEIGRANLDGTGVKQDFISLPPSVAPNGLDVENGFIYWADFPNSQIGRADAADGLNAITNYVTTATGPSDVEVDGSHIYWTNQSNGTIGSSDLDGTSHKTQTFLSGLSSPCGIALDLDFQNIWWSNQGGTTLGRANLLDASGRSDAAVTGANQPCGIDVDHGFAIPVSTPPSNAFTIGKLKRNRKKGTAKLAVTVPGPGMLTLTGKGVKPQRPAGAIGRSRARTVGAAGTVKLRIVARGKAKKRLLRTGSAKLKLTITFTPSGGIANAQPKTVRLKKR